MHTTHSCCTCLSRRECLTLLSSAASVPGLAAKALSEQTSQRIYEPGGPIDPAGLRPKPRVHIMAAILEMPRPYWLGWPGTAYDLDARQKEYLADLDSSAHRLGLHVDVEPSPISKEDAFSNFLGRVKSVHPHGVLVILQHMNCWNWADRLAREADTPVIIFSPIGTSFTGHVVEISRRKGVYVASTLDWRAVELGLRMIRAKQMFEEARILHIVGSSRGDSVIETLGCRVRAIPRDAFNTLFDRIPATNEVKAIAADFRRHAKAVREPTWQDSVNSARALVTAEQLMLQEQANNLSMDCLGMVGAKLVPTPPCGAWTILQDHGVTAGCEADLFGAVSLMLTSYLLDRPGYMNDPVADTARNLLVTAHCTCGTRIRGFNEPPVPYILRSHSESGLGVSVQVLWPVGQPVTLVRFTGPNELLVDTGTVVENIDTPPAGGCRTSLALKMDRIEDTRDVLGFHQVVTLGDHRRTLASFCQLYGIRLIHSPERSPSPA
ncbi:MAG: hypothetical protein ACP5VE_14900 [Chthonomonadales bacterium]